MMTALLPPVKSRMIDKTIKDLGVDQSSESLNVFTTTHEEHYSVAMKMFYDKDADVDLNERRRSIKNARRSHDNLREKTIKFLKENPRKMKQKYHQNLNKFYFIYKSPGLMLVTAENTRNDV